MGLDVNSAGWVRSGNVGEERDGIEFRGQTASSIEVSMVSTVSTVSIGEPRSISGVGERDIGENVVEMS